MYKCAHKTQGHVCESVCVRVPRSRSLIQQNHMCSLDLVRWEKSRMKKRKKLSETLSPISNCHCQERFLESSSESYEYFFYFSLGKLSFIEHKRSPRPSNPSLLHRITQTERERVKNNLPSEDGLSCFHAAYSMWSSFKHKQALF